MGVDDDIIEFSVRPGGFGCHVYFGCDYRCRVLLVETIDGWIPPVSPYSFDPETWHPKPCTSPQPEDFEERQQILAEFDAWEDNSGGGSDRQWG